MDAISALLFAAQAAVLPAPDSAPRPHIYERFMAGEVRLDQMSDEEAMHVVRMARKKRQERKETAGPAQAGAKPQEPQ